MGQFMQAVGTEEAPSCLDLRKLSAGTVVELGLKEWALA